MNFQIYKSLKKLNEGQSTYFVTLPDTSSGNYKI